MIKFSLCLAGFLVCSTFNLSANPMGNAFDPVFFEEGVLETDKSDTALRLGYIGDFVMDRKQQVRHQKQMMTERAHRDFNGADLTLNLYDRFDLFGRLGYASYNTQWGMSDGILDLVTRGDFSWSCGGRALVRQWEETILSISGSYTWGNSKVHRVELSGLSNGSDVVLDQNIDQREKKWNVGAMVGHQIENFTPYVGLQYIQDKTYFKKNAILIKSYDASGNEDSDSYPLPSFTSRRKIGLVVGLGLAAGKKATLNLEGRFVNESALTLTGQARF